MVIRAAFFVGSFCSFFSALFTSFEGSTAIPGLGLLGLLADEIAAPTPAPTPAVAPRMWTLRTLWRHTTGGPHGAPGAAHGPAQRSECGAGV